MAICLDGHLHNREQTFRLDASWPPPSLLCARPQLAQYRQNLNPAAAANGATAQAADAEQDKMQTALRTGPLRAAGLLSRPIGLWRPQLNRGLR